LGGAEKGGGEGGEGRARIMGTNKGGRRGGGKGKWGTQNDGLIGHRRDYRRKGRFNQNAGVYVVRRAQKQKGSQGGWEGGNGISVDNVQKKKGTPKQRTQKRWQLKKKNNLAAGQAQECWDTRKTLGNKTKKGDHCRVLPPCTPKRGNSKNEVKARIMHRRLGRA